MNYNIKISSIIILNMTTKGKKNTYTGNKRDRDQNIPNPVLFEKLVWRPRA